MRAMTLMPVFLLSVACVGEFGGPAGPRGPGMTPDPEMPTTGSRTARRLSAPQLRTALIGATGFEYVGRARVVDPSAPQGTVVRDDAPLFQVYGATLGNPDYNYVTQAALEPSITFAKLAEDGVRYACGQAAETEVAQGAHPSGRPHLLFEAEGTESLPAGEAAIRANIAHLALRFWGHRQSASDDETAALLPLYEAGFTSWMPPETDPPADESRARAAAGCRAVCIGMLSDPRFLTY